MSMDYIRRAYGVPAEVRGRVRYTGDKKRGPCLGTIVSTSGAHLTIRLDGECDAFPFHPTWELQYLNDRGEVICG